VKLKELIFFYFWVTYMFKNSLNAYRFLNYVVPPYHYLVPLIDVHKQGFVDKLHVCLVSNLCSRVGVFACL